MIGTLKELYLYLHALLSSVKELLLSGLTSFSVHCWEWTTLNVAGGEVCYFIPLTLDYTYPDLDLLLLIQKKYMVLKSLKTQFLFLNSSLIPYPSSMSLGPSRPNGPCSPDIFISNKIKILTMQSQSLNFWNACCGHDTSEWSILGRNGKKPATTATIVFLFCCWAVQVFEQHMKKKKHFIKKNPKKTLFLAHSSLLIAS